MGLKIFVLCWISLLLIIIMPKKSYAQYIAPAEVKPVGQISINKLVKNLQTGLFVENLSFSDPRFLPEQEVSFRLEVRNSGQIELTNVQIKDKLPDFVEFVAGPGSFDPSSQTLNFTIDRLRGGETKAYELKVRVKKAESLPVNIATCITNFAESRVNELVSQDTAVFCIETRVLGVTRELPVTGVSNSIPLFLSSIFLLATSFFILRKI